MPSKIYGQDGPPQLHDRNVAVAAEVLNQWVTAGSAWLGYRNDGEWTRLIRCRCGSQDAFAVRRADCTNPAWISGKYGGNQHCELACSKCGSELLLFDDGLHGYNAVVCDDRSTLPRDYVKHNRTLLTPLICRCGGRAFSVIASAIYDCADIEEMSLPEEKWDDAYGSFAADARCSQCGAVHSIAEAETA